MPITEILNFLIMQPLKLVFEFVYTLELLLFACPHGVAIIGLSIFMNFALLPMYNNAERIQKENDAKQKAMQPFVSHIKKTFHGAEQTMMLQTYYRENDYKMIYTLKSSLSLLIQIPFFMAAYRFLSNLALLKGTSFGPIQNLAQPDGLLALGNMNINVLPILMTIINIIAGAIYAKNSSKSTKIQIFGLAILFLVILYN